MSNQVNAEVDDLRTKLKAMHRRAQKAEAALAKVPASLRSVDTWKSPERQREAGERDRMMGAVGKASRRRRL